MKCLGANVPAHVEHSQVTAAVIISILVAYLGAGFRGGFIFPTFFAGTAFGHAVWRAMDAIPGIESWFGSMPPVLFCMTVAVGKGHSCVTHIFPCQLVLPSRSPGVPFDSKSGKGLQHCKLGTPKRYYSESLPDWPAKFLDDTSTHAFQSAIR